MSKSKKPFVVKRFDNKTENEIGQPINSWTDHKTIYGYMDMMSGNEQEQAYLEESTHILITWDIVDVTSKDRIYNERKGETYEITYVDNPMELDSQLEIYCKVV